MLLNLVKKDFLLVKKYSILMFIAAIALPVFISMKLPTPINGGILSFLISTLFIQFLMFNSVSMLEYKYKGSALLCATPYKRNTLVMAKYLFLLVIFAGCCILFTITAKFLPKQMERLSLGEIGLSFLILTVAFSIMVPVQYRFGFEKAKYIFFFSIFLTPFVLPVIAEYIQTNHFSFPMTLPGPQIIQDFTLFLLALTIGMISMMASTRIYSKQNL